MQLGTILQEEVKIAFLDCATSNVHKTRWQKAVLARFSKPRCTFWCSFYGGLLFGAIFDERELNCTRNIRGKCVSSTSENPEAGEVSAPKPSPSQQFLDCFKTWAARSHQLPSSKIPEFQNPSAGVGAPKSRAELYFFKIRASRLRNWAGFGLVWDVSIKVLFVSYDTCKKSNRLSTHQPAKAAAFHFQNNLWQDVPVISAVPILLSTQYMCGKEFWDHNCIELWDYKCEQ